MANCLVAEGLLQQTTLVWLKANTPQNVSSVKRKSFFMIIYFLS